MESLPQPPFDVVLVGAGRVATAVALLLQKSGHRIVAVASRTRTSAEAAAARLGAPALPTESLPSCDLVLLGVPEEALTTAAEDLAGAAGKRVLVHFAGSVGIRPLERVCPDAVLCALHPVQACPDVDTALARLPGSAWGVTCSPGAEEWAAALIQRDLEGTPIPVREQDRALWHAAAVTTSNGISALMATGEALLSAIGVRSPEAVLGPIAAGTVANARDLGGGAVALTGPVVRGEADVLRKHVAAVAERAPESMEPYLHALRSIVASARGVGRIDASRARELMSVLESR